jgi:predicted ATPase
MGGCGHFCSARYGAVIADRAFANKSTRWVFFDRGLIDAAAALEHQTGELVVKSLGSVYRYNKRVGLRGWNSTVRRGTTHGLAEAVAEYNRMTNVIRLWAATPECCPK